MKKATNQRKTLFITAEQNGYDMLTRNISRNTFLTDGAKALFIYLNSHNENFNLSAESIATYLHKSYRTIQRLIEELKENGFLILERKENKNTYYYKLVNSPKIERLNNDFTSDNIINAYCQNIIDTKEIDGLFNQKLITKSQYKEIMQKIFNIYKTKWLNDEE